MERWSLEDNEFPEGKFLPKMILGAAIGIILGTVLGSLSLSGNGILSMTAMLVMSCFLLESCRPRDVDESLFATIIQGFFRITRAILALGLFFGALFGTAYLVGLVLNHPAWSGFWDPAVRDYLWEGFITLFLLTVIEWIYRFSDRPFMENLLFVWMSSWNFGIIGFIAAGIAAMPFLIVSIFITVPPWPTGIFGALIGGLLGGSYGAILGLVALFTYSVLPYYMRWD